MLRKLQDPVTRRVAAGLASGALMLAYGLWISRSHITHVGYMIGLSGFEAETLFILVDFIALFGKSLTSRHLQAKTRRNGRQMMIGGLLLSLACNVVSGAMSGGWGPAGYGVFVVAMVVWLEKVTGEIKAKQQSVKRERTPKPPAAVVPGSRKCQPGCACRKHASRYPVSPGVGPVGDYAGRKA